MFGTDYPFPLGEQKMGELIQTSTHHSSAQKSKLLGGNAVTWLGLTDEEGTSTT